jgi:hypothetical protein
VIPYDVDPSLHDTQPQEPVLDDGFSRPEKGDDHPLAPTPADTALADKSDF